MPMIVPLNEARLPVIPANANTPQPLTPADHPVVREMLLALIELDASVAGAATLPPDRLGAMDWLLLGMTAIAREAGAVGLVIVLAETGAIVRALLAERVTLEAARVPLRQRLGRALQLTRDHAAAIAALDVERDA